MRAGILVATPQELKAIPGIENSDPIERVSGIDFYELEPGLYVCAGGVGKVNAAMAAEILCLRYHVDLIVNAGIAGCTKNVALGTLVVASEFMQHDVDTSAVGDEPGLVSTVNLVQFPAFAPVQSLVSLADLAHHPLLGLVATGDWFAQSSDRLWEIYYRFKPLVLDMEAGAVAQVCYRNNVGVTAVKAVSDCVFKPEQLREYSDCSKALDALGKALVPFTKELLQYAESVERKGHIE